MPRQGHRELMLDTLVRFRILLRSIDVHYRSVERRSGLGGAQLWALSEVAAAPLTMGELAQTMAVHPSTASNLVARLAQLGLVRRERDESDRRVVRLLATTVGRQRLRRAPRPSAGLLQEALLRMADRNLRALRGRLDEVIGLMGRVDRKKARAIPLAEMLGTDAQRRTAGASTGSPRARHAR